MVRRRHVTDSGLNEIFVLGIILQEIKREQHKKKKYRRTENTGLETLK